MGTMREHPTVQEARTADALQRARKANRRTGRPAVANICVDTRVYTLETRNQTTYK
jgi:hypothetical protein